MATKNGRMVDNKKEKKEKNGKEEIIKKERINE
jgi:hypothetical protein